MLFPFSLPCGLGFSLHFKYFPLRLTMEKPTEDAAFFHQPFPKQASPATGLRLASGRLCGGGSGHGKGTVVTAGWGCAMLQGSGTEVPAGLQVTRGWELGRKYLNSNLHPWGCKEDQSSDRESSQGWAVSLKGRPHPGAGQGVGDPLPMLSGGMAPRQPQGKGCLLFCSLSGCNLKGRRGYLCRKYLPPPLF